MAHVPTWRMCLHGACAAPHGVWRWCCLPGLQECDTASMMLWQCPSVCVGWVGVGGRQPQYCRFLHDSGENRTQVHLEAWDGSRWTSVLWTAVHSSPELCLLPVGSSHRAARPLTALSRQLLALLACSQHMAPSHKALATGAMARLLCAAACTAATKASWHACEVKPLSSSWHRQRLGLGPALLEVPVPVCLGLACTHERACACVLGSAADRAGRVFVATWGCCTS
jgi:hypothetical protein